MAAKKVVAKVLEVNDKVDAKVDAEIDKLQKSRFSSLAAFGSAIFVLVCVLVLLAA